MVSIPPCPNADPDRRGRPGARSLWVERSDARWHGRQHLRRHGRQQLGWRRREQLGWGRWRWRQHGRRHGWRHGELRDRAVERRAWIRETDPGGGGDGYGERPLARRDRRRLT